MTQSLNEFDMAPEHPPVRRFVEDIMDAARENPIPTALIGLGALWLLARESPLGDIPRSIARTGAGLMSSARQRATSGLDSADQAADEWDAAESPESAMGAGQHALDLAQRSAIEHSYRAAQGLKDGAQFVRDNLTDLWDRQPLLPGAIGLAVGAGIAAAFPSSSMETELFGEQAQNLADQAEDLIAETAEHVRDAVSPVA